MKAIAPQGGGVAKGVADLQALKIGGETAIALDLEQQLYKRLDALTEFRREIKTEVGDIKALGTGAQRIGFAAAARADVGKAVQRQTAEFQAATRGVGIVDLRDLPLEFLDLGGLLRCIRRGGRACGCRRGRSGGGGWLGLRPAQTRHFAAQLLDLLQTLFELSLQLVDAFGGRFLCMAECRGSQRYAQQRDGYGKA